MRTFELILKPAYKDQNRVYLPEPIDSEQSTKHCYFYNKERNAISSIPSELTRYELVNLRSDFPEFMSYFDVKVDTDMLLKADYLFSDANDDGHYVVKMGDFYLGEIKDYITSIDLSLERELRGAKYMPIDKAKYMTNRYGGKVIKVNLELEEV